MIVDRPGSHFVFVVPWDHVHRRYNYINLGGKPLTNREYLDSWGKWLVFGTAAELAALARDLDALVEERRIPAAKYDRQRIEEFGLHSCVMCVYCHSEQRQDVWELLSALGVQDRMWMLERETMEKWLPGGVNLEKWIKGRNMSPEMAERVRRSATSRFKQLLDNPEATFTGIEQ